MDATQSLPDTAVCLHCGYSLRGLPENVCPECGRGFDPADRRTWRDTAQRTLWLRLALRWSYAPPRWHSGMTIGITLFLLLWMTFTLWPFNPQYDGHKFFISSIPIFLPGLSLLFPLMLSYILRWAACRRFRRRRMRPYRTSWLVFPACLLAVVAASFYPWPLALSFAVSRPWFNQAVERASVEKTMSGSRQVGLFRVSRIDLWEPARVRFECWAGFDIHYDARTRPESPHYLFRLGSNWYVWTDVPLWRRWPHPTTTRILPPNPFFCLIRSALGF